MKELNFGDKVIVIDKKSLLMPVPAVVVSTEVRSGDIGIVRNSGEVIENTEWINVEYVHKSCNGALEALLRRTDLMNKGIKEIRKSGWTGED